MTAVSKQLHELTLGLQSIKSLQTFALAGGTSLAMRFNHRISVDIDLFTNEIIGIKGFQTVSNEITNTYGEAVFGIEILNTESGDQFCFLRSFIKSGEDIIKVELLQNMQRLYPPENLDNIRILSVCDIALYKLVSAANRKAKKDIYDLNRITGDIPLSELLELLEQKTAQFTGEQYKCLFDLDAEINPLTNLTALLDFEKITTGLAGSKPFHTHDRIQIVDNNPNWLVAKNHWRRKVMQAIKDRK